MQKKADKTSMANCRTISLHTVFSKIHENVTVKPIITHQ